MEVREYINSLLTKKGFNLNGISEEHLNKFSLEEENIELVNQIFENQNSIMKRWKINYT